MIVPVLVLAEVSSVAAALRGMWSPCGLSMVSALNPMAEHARGHRYPITAAWYVAGAFLGGAVLGAGCALGAAAIRSVVLSADDTLAVVIATAGVAYVMDTTPLGRRLPIHPRQVNERWITQYRRWIYAAGFGCQIGSGFATYIMTAAVYLTAALAILSASPSGAVLVGLTFGTIRGFGVLCSAKVRTSAQLVDLHRRLDRSAVASLAVCGAVEVGVAGGAAWLLAGPAAAVCTVAALGAVQLARLRPIGCLSGGRGIHRAREGPHGDAVAHMCGDQALLRDVHWRDRESGEGECDPSRLSCRHLVGISRSCDYI